jgi:hypothetical protein
MFRCPITGRVSLPGVKPVSVVLQRRSRAYFDTPDGHEPDANFYPSTRWSGREVGHGTEIVRECLISKEGLAEIEARTAA